MSASRPDLVQVFGAGHVFKLSLVWMVHPVLIMNFKDLDAKSGPEFQATGG